MFRDGVTGEHKSCEVRRVRAAGLLQRLFVEHGPFQQSIISLFQAQFATNAMAMIFNGIRTQKQNGSYFTACFIL